MNKIKLLKDWGDYKAGEPLSIDGPVDDLIKQGIAELYDPEKEKAAKEAAEKAKKEAEEKAKAEQVARLAELRRVVKEGIVEVAKGDSVTLTGAVTGTRDVSDDDETGGYKYFTQFLLDVREASIPGHGVPERLKAWQTKVEQRQTKVAGHLAEGDNAQGGFLVPIQFLADLLKKPHGSADLMRRCRKIPLETNSLDIPAVAESSRVAGQRYGGISLTWVDEAGQKGVSKPTFEKISLKLKKLAGMVYVSEELLEDSPISIEAIITDAFTEELANVVDHAIINGNGIGQPQGILTAGCLVPVAIQPAQANTTIVSQNVINMWSRMFAPSRANAIWLINQDCEPQLFTMSLAVGAGGIPVYMPANGLAGSPYATLFGRPVVPCEWCPTLGTLGDIIFADMQQYILATKSRGIHAASSIHFRFDYNEVTFRFELRVDGQPWWRTPLTPASGSINTLSPFVALAGRP